MAKQTEEGYLCVCVASFRLQKQLQQQLFKPGCVEGLKPGDLGERIEEEMRTFLDVDLRGTILAQLTLCKNTLLFLSPHT